MIEGSYDNGFIAYCWSSFATGFFAVCAVLAYYFLLGRLQRYKRSLLFLRLVKEDSGWVLGKRNRMFRYIRNPKLADQAMIPIIKNGKSEGPFLYGGMSELFFMLFLTDELDTWAAKALLPVLIGGLGTSVVALIIRAAAFNEAIVSGLVANSIIAYCIGLGIMLCFLPSFVWKLMRSLFGCSVYVDSKTLTAMITDTYPGDLVNLYRVQPLDRIAWQEAKRLLQDQPFGEEIDIGHDGPIERLRRTCVRELIQALSTACFLLPFVQKLDADEQATATGTGTHLQRSCAMAQKFLDSMLKAQNAAAYASEEKNPLLTALREVRSFQARIQANLGPANYREHPGRRNNCSPTEESTRVQAQEPSVRTVQPSASQRVSLTEQELPSADDQSSQPPVQASILQQIIVDSSGSHS